MSRRGEKTQIELGSDSFLDVVANIVGILIILMVVAGVRVSQAPVPRQVESVVIVPEPAIAARPEPLPVLEPSPALVREAERLEQELAALSEARLEQQAALQSAEVDAQRAGGQLETVRATLTASREALAAERTQVTALQRRTDELRSRLGQARRQLDAAEELAPPVQQLKHRLTPISRSVQGKEVHFHLARGRVAHVPIEELVERLKSQISRQKDWLAKYRQHQGEVGPVDGFSMQYVVEREPISVIDDVRLGGSAVMRIGVSEWQLRPERHLRGESVAEALRPGSAFIRTLRMAPSDAALTFWVYPDSFELYRELQEFAHAEGFTVAARPLPFGMPIAGSPNGTRSAGQ